MHKAFVKPIRMDLNTFLRSGWMFWSVISICAIVTGYAYIQTQSQMEARNSSRFKSITDENLAALRVRMQLYGHSLDGAAGLIAASDNVTLLDWQHYIETLEIENKLPGIRGIGMIVTVPWGEEAQFLDAAGADGVDNLQIHPEKAWGERFVIKYMEPLSSNEGMIGFDISVYGDKRLAAVKATETGMPMMTQHMDFLDHHGDQSGFLLLRPYYTMGMPIDTAEQRRAASKGWIFTRFIGEQLLQKLTIDQESKFHISVFDGITTNANTLIYNSDNTQTSTIDADYQASENINIFGRNWTVIWHSTPEFDASHRSNAPFFVLMAGLLFSIFYTSIIGALTYREHKVQRLIKQKTQELATVEERWNLALKGAEIGVFDIDLLTGKSFFSDTLKRLMNIPLDDLSTDPQKEFFKKTHPEDLPVVLARNAACIKGKTDRSVSEYRVQTSPDVFRWMRSDSVVVSRDENGKALRFVGSQTDITDLHEMRTSLRASIERFQALFTHAPVGMALINDKATLIGANIALCNFLDLSEREILDKRYWDIMLPGEFHKIGDKINALKNGELQTYQSEHQFVGKNGKARWGLASVSLDKDPTTGRDLYITQIQDINEIKELEKVKGEFVATVSHELRTPLTSVKGALGLLQATMDKPIPEATRRLLEIANSNCSRLTLLVNDILDMEKITSGNLELNWAQEKLKSILTASVEHIEPYAKECNVSIKLNIPSENLEIWTDSGRVQQVMSNLLSNAAKFSNDGSEVHVNYEQTKGSVRVSVCNFGTGIPEDFKQDIFKPFLQADSSATRQKGGTGLGLNISKQIVEQLGGEIGFDSISDSHTTFWFTLPLKKTDPTPKDTPVLAKLRA